jgi:hypothetical protein
MVIERINNLKPITSNSIKVNSSNDLPKSYNNENHNHNYVKLQDNCLKKKSMGSADTEDHLKVYHQNIRGLLKQSKRTVDRCTE